MLSLCRSESLVTFGLVVELMLLHLTRSADLDALLLEWSAATCCARPTLRVVCAAALAVELPYEPAPAWPGSNVPVNFPSKA